MTVRRKPRAHFLDHLIGHRLPGGCDDCDAYQTVTATDYGHKILIHHDDSCPFYRGMTPPKETP